MYSEMPTNVSQLDEVMCGPYNRRGLLCGECKDGYGPAVNSFDQKCANCSTIRSGYAITLYLLLQFVPTIIIFVCSVVFHFNITSGPMLGYIFFCQTMVTGINYRKCVYDYIQSHGSSFLGVLFRFSVTLTHFWSLQFLTAALPPFCISDKLTDLHVHMLNFVPAVYSLFLFFISCTLMELHARNYRIVKTVLKPFRSILSRTKTTEVASVCVFQALASLIFLSGNSALCAISEIRGMASLYNSIGIFQKKVLYIAPTVDWHSYQSVTYGLIVGVTFISVSVIPSVLLCIYPTRVYRYLSRFLSARKRLAITAFAEALHSCFKDGLNGTRDYRALAGAQLFLILLGSVASMFLYFLKAHNITMDGATTYTVEILLWMMFVCLVSYVKPCKSAIANVSLSFHLILFGILDCVRYLWWYDSYARTYPLELTFIATLLTPHILVALWAGYTLTKHTLTRFGYEFHGPGCKVALSDMANGVRLCLSRRYSGYQEIP